MLGTETMKLYRYKIAGGNSTSLVEDYDPNKQQAISMKELESVEQVGFIDTNSQIPRLTMMGNELCVNATLAFAKKIGDRRGIIKTSGVDSAVIFSNMGEMTSATFALKPKVIRDRSIVLFDGIGYVCSDNPVVPTQSYLADLAEEFKLPAFGIARFQGDSLQPYVYVKQTDSVIPETACGSGSIALSLITGSRNITQPTGQRINVMRNGNQFTVTAKVVKMKR